MFIRYNGSTLFYTRQGHGPENMLLFHGFGQDHRAFDTWVAALANTHTLYIVDLYYHGQSTWPTADSPIEKADWRAILELLLAGHALEHFSLAGYSIGARFALATAEAFPERTTTVFLIAPDGITGNTWYALATGTVPARRIFHGMIAHHGRFLSAAQALQSLRLVTPNQVKFASYHMSTEERRRRVYAAWVVFRRLTFSRRALAAALNMHRVGVVMIVGKHDPVIRAEGMPRFLRLVQRHHLATLDAGHSGLIAHSLPLLQQPPIAPPPTS
ncbi:alpha/beta fold hydrolase [Dawidia soli]|uniref:Alpha/beta hydrolase n=1 Tax=Dawidia soli TaxID=2782352 RepID=A0AAP2GE25_9BACT|nr:alpha/beta hydrolase [Dawidia soli]MBT1687934.1 alpha/beta hydrolase [Dawidia soli]